MENVIFFFFHKAFIVCDTEVEHNSKEILWCLGKVEQNSEARLPPPPKSCWFEVWYNQKEILEQIRLLLISCWASLHPALSLCYETSAVF